MQDIAQKLIDAGATSANVWEKHGKRRVYIDFPKLNGGKNWNGGRGVGQAYYDADQEQIVVREQSWAGAKTRSHALEILRAIESDLGIGWKEV